MTTETERHELIKLGVLVDSGKPLSGRIFWIPNPKLTEEQQLTEEQRKVLIEGNGGDRSGHRIKGASNDSQRAGTSRALG